MVCHIAQANVVTYGSLMAVRGNEITAVPLREVAGKLQWLTKDHELIRAGLNSGASFGAEL